MRLSAAVAVACLSIGLATGHDAEASIKKDTTIPAQGLGQALQQLAKERDVQLVYRSEVVGDRQTSGVTGELTFEEALTKLLSGTGLAFEYLEDKAITIISDPSSRAVPKNGSSAQNSSLNTQDPSVWDRFRLAQVGEENRGSSSGSDSSQSATEELGRRVTLEEVVVTAQKREERSIDVPMSVTAISGDKLTAAGIQNLQDLSSAVPSLTVSESGPGRQMIVMRGVHSQRGSSSLVGTYLDEMPLTGVQDGLIPAYADLRVIDLDRVEVLKGPQGTLFGEGAAGGVIRLITKDPNLDRAGGDISTEVYNTTDGGWSEEVGGVLNVPLVSDVLGIRVAAKYEDISGWVDEPSIGREDINDSEVKHVRVKALYAPLPDLQVKGMFEMHRNDGGGTNIVNQEPHEDSNFLQAFDRSAPTGYTDDYDLYNLTATYDFGFAELLSSTSYAKLDSVQSFTQLVGQAPTPSLEILFREYSQDASITSQELRLTSATNGPFNWTMGAAYKDADISRSFGEHGADAVLFGGTVVRTGLQAGTRPTTKSESWAAFSNVSYKLTDRFEVGGGLRYFYDKREAFEPTNRSLGIASGDFEKLTFRTYVKYQAATNVNLYLNAANGFRSGGFNTPSQVPRGAPPSYEPENIMSYEAGMKMLLLDARVRFDAAVFYSEYEDMQEDNLIASPVDGAPLQFTANSQDAELMGFEWDINWAATDRLTLAFAGDIIDTEIVHVDPANLTPNYFVGDPISLVPKYSLSATADYRFQWRDSTPVFFLLTFSRQGKSYFIERSNALITVKHGSAPEKNFLNASVGVEVNGWELSVFGRNLLDEREILYPAATGWTAQARPRTLGVAISKSF